MSEQVDISGKCLCGAVRFTAQTASRHFGACHCSMCRKWGSGPFMEVECGTSVRFEGEENITVFNSSEWGERGFCAKCGTNLFYRIKESGSTGIAAGVIDDMTGFEMIAQVCIDDKPPYYSFAEKTRELTCADMFELFEASKNKEA